MCFAQFSKWSKDPIAFKNVLHSGVIYWWLYSEPEEVTHVASRENVYWIQSITLSIRNINNILTVQGHVNIRKKLNMLMFLFLKTWNLEERVERCDRCHIWSSSHQGAMTTPHYFCPYSVLLNTHTKVCNNDIRCLVREWQEKVFFSFPGGCSVSVDPSFNHKRKSATPQFRFPALWSMRLYVALPFTVLYYQAFYYINAFPVMSSWGHPQKQGLSSGVLIGRDLIEARPIAFRCGSRLSCGAARQGRVFLSTSVWATESITTPQGVYPWPVRGEQDSSAHTHSTAPPLQLTADKWEGESGREGGSSWWGSEERRQSSQTFQGPPFQSNEA